jgi:4-amino-4-deoxy-L-arabinose transferase-like glycosyltransferase
VFAASGRWFLVAAALYLVLFFGLTGAGLVGPDEPRYASIGREMARSGDWVTPRLWGDPWFEKPPLLYWMTASAFRLGLGDDLAPRLPVALLSTLFLLLYHGFLRAEFGWRAALFATAILGTSALWVAFSQVAVTDLPMSATFAAGMLMGMRWLSSGNRRWLAGAAVLLGLAVTAKGLVPLVLALPLLWVGRKRLGDFLRPLPIAGFLAVALPWYLLCGLQNGSPFWDELFGRHHFARFTSGVLLHPRPFWFFIPVLAAGFHPWTPLLVPLLRKSFYSDARRRFLLLWVVFGFLFFSASTGKLPGYILPLFPALAALAGVALDEARRARWLLAACCLLLVITPVVSRSFPRALADGLSRTPVGGWHWGFAGGCLAAAVVVWWLESTGKRNRAAGLSFALVILSILLVKIQALPELDRLASGRPLWRRVSASPNQVCVEGIHRSWRYSLNYYSITPLPECSQAPRPVRIRQLPGAPPFVD